MPPCPLQIRDPGKYNWDPKGLLQQICVVYLNLYRADRGGVLAAAIAADARSYRPAMFAEASHVLRQFQLLGETEVGWWVVVVVSAAVAVEVGSAS